MDPTIEAALITAGISLAMLFIQRAFDRRTQEKNDASHEKDMQAKAFMPELDKENEKDEKKEKNLIDYADINKIKEHLIQRRTKQFNGKSETESTQDGEKYYA